MIKRTLQSDTCLTKEIYDFLKPEMTRGLIAQKTLAEIETEVMNGQAFIIVEQARPIGYVSFKEWQSGIEIMTIVVRPSYRCHGNGTRLARAALTTVKNEFPRQRVFVLPNKNSAGIFQKLGLVTFLKANLPEELRDACVGCREEPDFPNCHCKTMIWPQVNQTNVSMPGDPERKCLILKI